MAADSQLPWNLLKVVRGHIVAGGVLAFTVGALLAVAGGGVFNVSTALVLYAVVFCGDLSTHFSNDYFDADVDTKTGTKKFFSGRKILAKNPALKPKARLVAVGLLAASIVLASLAVAFRMAPPEAFLIAVAANLLGWFYSSPPLRLGSKGLGEAAIAFCAGFAIPAFGYVAVKGQLDLLFCAFAVPFMLYAFMLALSLEAPDIEADRLGNRRNIGVRLGKRVVYGFVLAAAFAAFACFVFEALFMGGLNVNFGIVAVFGLVPLTAGAVGLAYAFLRRFGDAFGTVNVVALFVFNVLMIGYLALVALYPV